MYSIFGFMLSHWNPTEFEPLDERLLTALALCEGIGPASFHRLLSAFGTPEGVFGAPSWELKEACPHLGVGTFIALSRGPDFAEVDRQLEECDRHGVRLATWRSAFYPPPLLDLPQPPPLLFMQGEWRETDRRAMAVVGTRRPSLYGEKAAKAFGLRLAEVGWTVVSGLARGIDTIAHQAALQGGSRTLAVLGSGLDRLYPRENENLARRIAEAGCVMTEFPMGTDPKAENFPRRNRIISALSYGTLVVEADQDSGALITAQYAVEQGREVFAVPGPIMTPGARGTHRLIKDGAHLVENVKDILDVLEGQSQAAPARRIQVRPREREDGAEKVAVGGFPGTATLTLTADADGTSKAASVHSTARAGAPSGIPHPKASADLRDSHRLLLDLLGSETVSLDGLSERMRALPRKSALPVHRLLADLLQLELLGLVRRMPGAVFRRG